MKGEDVAECKAVREASRGAGRGRRRKWKEKQKTEEQ